MNIVFFNAKVLKFWSESKQDRNNYGLNGIEIEIIDQNEFNLVMIRHVKKFKILIWKFLGN